MLRLRVMGAVKTCLSTRPVSFISKSEVEVYQLEDAVRVMRYSERNKLKKRLKAAAVDVPKSTTSTSSQLQRVLKDNIRVAVVYHGG